MKTRICNSIARLLAFATSAMALCSFVYTPCFAENGNTAVVGKLYEFEEKSEYEISSAQSSSTTTSSNTYGEFLLNGNIKNSISKNGVPSYEVEDGKLSLVYKYDDTLLNADMDSWHLFGDDVNKIDGQVLANSVQKGTILLQTSMDRLNWTDAVCMTNVFSSTPICSDSFYESKDIELINGCYYKVIVAYETRIRTEDSNFWFVDTDKFDYKKYAEVYEFYAYTGSSNEKETIDYSRTYNIGSRVRTKNFDGYYGEENIVKNDIHYGWDLGNFFISGYTDKRVSNDEVVLLKNVGDKVTLWFNLSQNIDALNGQNNLFISSDSSAFDQYFETPKTDFGKGALIIRYTDYNNNKSEPQIYTNYLEANTSFGTDTKVQLFEEGDYEVALDYEVTKDELIDTKGHYHIFFKFSVRNGNCMAYPFDIATGSELTNSSMTENGFRLDLAKSRYLKVNIKREVLKDSADGLVEDTRFNGPAKDGEEYTEEGIYTITVSNDYTNQFTVKKIYVGTNKVLRAYMTTGLSIPEINNLVADGATIMDDGTIKLAEKVIEPDKPTESNQTSEPVTESETSETNEVADVNPSDTAKNIFPIIIVVVIAAVVSAGVCVTIVIVRKKAKSELEKLDDNNEGGKEK